MEEKKIFFAKENNPTMIEAFSKAQETFKYFWRELSWEYRRIVPALDLACVKVAFLQNINNAKEPTVEHMWINEVNFDGENLTGILINEPNELTNIKKGDTVEIPLAQMSDWLFSSQGSTYGGFTIQALRSDMSPRERREHDQAWGLNFGSFNEVLIVYQQKEKPDNLIEHPMSKNMREKLIDFVKQHPAELTSKDELGYTFLHKETIAGNKNSVEVLIEAGANIDAKTNSGKTAFDFAKKLHWEHIIPLLERV